MEWYDLVFALICWWALLYFILCPIPTRKQTRRLKTPCYQEGCRNSVHWDNVDECHSIFCRKHATASGDKWTGLRLVSGGFVVLTEIGEIISNDDGFCSVYCTASKEYLLRSGNSMAWSQVVAPCDCGRTHRFRYRVENKEVHFTLEQPYL
ncbi:MAG: hypothetical protein GWN86_17245 [Desulfobacterales bacterium]|nr:hypothetical protein [Desulfobacterales bacterium]